MLRRLDCKPSDGIGKRFCQGPTIVNRASQSIVWYSISRAVWRLNARRITSKAHLIETEMIAADPIARARIIICEVTLGRAGGRRVG